MHARTCSTAHACGSQRNITHPAPMHVVRSCRALSTGSVRLAATQLARLPTPHNWCDCLPFKHLQQRHDSGVRSRRQPAESAAASSCPADQAQAEGSQQQQQQPGDTFCATSQTTQAGAASHHVLSTQASELHDTATGPAAVQALPTQQAVTAGIKAANAPRTERKRSPAPPAAAQGNMPPDSTLADARARRGQRHAAAAASAAPWKAHAKPRLSAAVKQQVKEAAQLAGLSDTALKQRLRMLRVLVPDFQEQLRSLHATQLAGLLTADLAAMAASMVQARSANTAADAAETGVAAASASAGEPLGPQAVAQSADSRTPARRGRGKRQAAAAATAAAAPWNAASKPQLTWDKLSWGEQQLVRAAARQAGLTNAACKERVNTLYMLVPNFQHRLHSLPQPQLAALLTADARRMAAVIVQLRDALAPIGMSAGAMVADCPALLLAMPSSGPDHGSSRSTSSSYSTGMESGSSGGNSIGSSGGSSISTSGSGSSTIAVHDAGHSSSSTDADMGPQASGDAVDDSASPEAEVFESMIGKRVAAFQAVCERLMHEPRRTAADSAPVQSAAWMFGLLHGMKRLLEFYPELLCHSATSISSMSVEYKQPVFGAPFVRYLVVDDVSYFVDPMI